MIFTLLFDISYLQYYDVKLRTFKCYDIKSMNLMLHDIEMKEIQTFYAHTKHS